MMRQRGCEYGWIVAIALALVVGGCAPRVQPVFDARADAPMWPPSTRDARIRYVGQLASAEDLRPTRSAFETLGSWIAGPPEPQPFYGPRAVLRTHDNRYLWVADPGGRCIHLLDLESRRYRKITHADNAPLLSPIDLCFGRAGSVLVCDSESGDVHAFAESTGVYQRTLRMPTEIGRPVAIDFAPDAGELYVVDVVHHDIKVLGGDDQVVRILGKRGKMPGEFNFPCDIALDGDALWVADTGNNRVQRITLRGDPVSMFGQAGDMPGDFAMPKCLAVDCDGHLYVVDSRFENVQVFDRAGQLLLIVGDEGVGPGEFWLPGGIFIDGENRIWVCDSYNARVQAFDYTPDAVAQAADSPGPIQETQP
ncbi:MAG: 6-bladed beta-propeller [Phycisphaerales bacterium]|nr:6-bladed beta-propeller [Phycisphaerales bacterium]